MKMIEITKEIKKMPVWKAVAFGAVCILQEYEIYKELCRDRAFDNARGMKKVADRFWKAAASGYSMDELYLLEIEQSVFSPQDEWDDIARCFIDDIYDFFYAVYEK